VTATFDGLGQMDLAHARKNKRPWECDSTSILKLTGTFGGKHFTEITPQLSNAIRRFAWMA
jgi:hypothetical protein